MTENIYYRFGKAYRKLERNEIIKKGAMHAIHDGELKPIISPDTIGDTPASFSLERVFYNPIDEEDL